MQHMTGVGDHALGQLPKAGLARGEIGARELQHLGRFRLGAGYPEHGRDDLAPARLGFLDPVENRVDELVRGIARELDAAVGLRPPPVPREERGLLAAQPGIVAAQACGKRFEVLVVAKPGLIRKLAQPARVTLGRSLGAWQSSSTWKVLDSPGHAPSERPNV